MKISWYSTAALILESDGHRIAIDPFLGLPLNESLLRRKLRAVKFRTADAVLVTHGQFDHILDIPRLYQDREIKIYATKTPCLSLLARDVKKSQLKLIRPGVSFQIHGFKVTVYQGRHCRYDIGLILKTALKKETLSNIGRLLELIRINRSFPENGETVFYEIEAEGKRVQIMGSMGLDVGTLYPKNADALILPFQGTSNPAATVSPIIMRLDPKKIWLDHYDNSFPPLSSAIDTLDFTAKLRHSGLPVMAMRFGETYEI